MRFKVRSLGGKLIFVAALTLLLCMILFSALSLGLLKYLSERDARSDAATHLSFINRAYQAQTATLIHNLEQVAANNDVNFTASQPSTPHTVHSLGDMLAQDSIQYHMTLLTFDIIGGKRQLLGNVDDGHNTNDTNTLTSIALIKQALQGKEGSALQAVTSADGSRWVLSVAVPILDRNNKAVAVLKADQEIDDAFALDLVQNTSFNTVLCADGRIMGTTMGWFSFDKFLSENNLCTTKIPNRIDGTQHFLTLATSAQTEIQLQSSPSLVIVDVEPLYSINTHIGRSLQILLAIGIFVFALGIISFAFITRYFFIRPMRRLQTRVRSLVAINGNAAAAQITEASPPIIDELSMLTRSFNLLSESLSVQESESQAMTKQMRDLLIMSDAFISSLNLEHLLGEIVSRLGAIMQVKHVSLLLYGREMLEPWAVARWANQASALHPSSSQMSLKHGAVTVHADPDRDITLAVTTKLAAMPVTRPGSSSDKRKAIGAQKYSQAAVPYGLRRPRIPRPALSDLDKNLAWMTMRRQRIVYGEDIVAIHHERGELWSQMALEAGFRSVMAVPMLLQEQPIGVLILYDDKPHQMTNQDTFVLKNLAVQAAIAIQNALLFAEVKDKNAALERVNHLKSQFLATVTHELRTPLHSIISYGALILEGFLDGELTREQEEHIQFMVRSAEDLSHLVDDMLDLSKIEADRLEVKAEALPLEPCLQEVVDQLKPLANNKGLYLTLEMADTLPMAMADSHRIRQITINLVSNALKFTEKGGVTIRCILLENYDMLRISVHDSGIGISPAALDYIFEAFRQADGSTTRRFGGTGLGLTIARKLIELQGGEVAVESIVGQGSTFSFTLPVVSPFRR